MEVVSEESFPQHESVRAPWNPFSGNSAGSLSYLNPITIIETFLKSRRSITYPFSSCRTVVLCLAVKSNADLKSRTVTVQLLHSDQKGIEDDVVAVMTDNDSTVRIFSLKQSRLLQTLNFPTFMNHASISGDGKLLLAVGDDRRAFFYQKNVIPGATDVGAYSFARHEWHEFADVKLPLPDSTDVCFSTAFSPSGHICAVASQKGFITIYNTTLVRDGMDSNEAVIHVLQTSRPCVGQSGCGAIRSMSFSPAPWDLLAWAEDHGRMCVVDLRNAFQSRQTVVLETESPYLLRAEVEDHDYTAEQRQLEIERRLVERHREALEAEDHFAAVNDAADYVEVAAARRRSERESPNVASQTLRDNPQGLTESERQMIDSIGLRRIRENHPEDSDISTTAPVSLSYNNASLGSLSSTNSSNPHSRSTANIHDFMRQRNLERSRGNERSWQPRRPSSVVISNSDTNSAPSDLSSSQHSSLAPVGTAIPPLSTSPSRLQSGSNLTGSPHLMAVDPWDTIINSMSSTNLPGDVMSRFGSLRSRNLDRRMQAQALENSLAIARADPGASRTDRTRGTNARAVRQMRAAVGRADPVYDEIDREVLLRRVHPPRYPRPNEGVVTTGIGWSWDGRSL